ncbi:protein-L-isoaspartate O-methyltransferase [Streptomyces sp. 2333.5]|uniref:protein-L-isoaspartate(D-aspartate) O-methyltransferase n=1 Tax=unclassified Streptomyces TaxID=2593676 RepID=UPI000899E28D|nr:MULTISPECIES: protein-L-isoaspartate(D-aspartate) O-methyltransferase [unclassified Streptomyces]PJJ02487.1 protein-L-isoaspartate O-methyltransferase [Streptomyces sp. 2333.5]SED12427.1 Protein-L-isoaspartate O-methyltransferase [Streptomyces sp. 2314.4]SED99571.1 Protein-L-isoaspartate O-methyltransferase [Streptomyces sp. 2112.2]
MDWKKHAERLAAETVHPSSRWAACLAATPRHVFVPRWWMRGEEGWELCDGPADERAWREAAYSNRTLVTRVGPLHADDAEPGTVPEGLPTSSSTLPSLVIDMYRHAMLTDECDVLVTTGTGYGTALACRRLGDKHVTSIDVDPVLVKSAGDRLESIGLHPQMAVCDITDPLPGTYDRIVATVSVRPIPVSWLAALRPGGRLVTTIAHTGLIVTADKTEDGGAFGRIEPDMAGFMATRHGVDYEPTGTGEVYEHAKRAEGEGVSRGRYPVLYVPDAWDVWSMLELAVPGIDHRTMDHADGETRTVWLLHPDGSWARAEGRRTDPPTVHQSGPRRLWDELERIRHRLNTEGSLPVYGAMVRIYPDGTTCLKRGDWTATVA